MTNAQNIAGTIEILTSEINRLQKYLFENQEIRHDEIQKNPDYVETYEYMILVEVARTTKTQIKAYTEAVKTLELLKDTLDLIK